jgi:hypothetical protein
MTTASPSVIDGDKNMLVDATQVRGPILGGRSDMWLHRRLKDPNPDTKFPDPDVVIANRRYWYLGTIRRWIAAQAARGKTRGPATGAAAALFILLTGNLTTVPHQIWGRWALVMTRGCDPATFITTASGNQTERVSSAIERQRAALPEGRSRRTPMLPRLRLCDGDDGGGAA